MIAFSITNDAFLFHFVIDELKNIFYTYLTDSDAHVENINVCENKHQDDAKLKSLLAAAKIGDLAFNKNKRGFDKVIWVQDCTK